MADGKKVKISISEPDEPAHKIKAVHRNPDVPCCEGMPEVEPDRPIQSLDGRHVRVAPDTADSLNIFVDFVNASNAPGAIDARGKRLMAIALSVALRSKPSLLTHIQAALSAGITSAEIHEAANLATAFAGFPAMIVFREVCAELKL
mgnify:CR=1 FL=1